MRLHPNIRKSLSVVLLAALVLLTSLATTSRASAQVVCSPSHIVQPGENLFRIALANGTTWPILAQINALPDPNRILIGQVICLPGSTVPIPNPPVTPLPPVVVPPSSGLTLPPPGVFPTIDFNTRQAGPGDTIVITGVNFPTNEPVDIFITPKGAAYPLTASASAVTSNTGTLGVNFTVPSTIDGAPLHGSPLSVLVRGRITGYFGFNFFFNPRP